MIKIKRKNLQALEIFLVQMNVLDDINALDKVSYVTKDVLDGLDDGLDIIADYKKFTGLDQSLSEIKDGLDTFLENLDQYDKEQINQCIAKVKAKIIDLENQIN